MNGAEVVSGGFRLGIVSVAKAIAVALLTVAAAPLYDLSVVTRPR
jgi:hypothetical protein